MKCKSQDGHQGQAAGSVGGLRLGVSGGCGVAESCDFDLNVDSAIRGTSRRLLSPASRGSCLAPTRPGQHSPQATGPEGIRPAPCPHPSPLPTASCPVGGEICERKDQLVPFTLLHTSELPLN